MSVVNLGGVSFGSTTTCRTTIGTGCFLVSGWFRPTSIVDNMCLWNAGSGGTGLFANTTGGSIKLGLSRATTDRIVATNYAALVANQWSFICVVAAGQSTVSELIWVGTETSIPTTGAVTVTTAGAGNFIGESIFVTGVNSGGSGGFSGSYSQITLINHMTDVLNIGLNESYLFNRFVYPLYTGTFDRQMLRSAFNGSLVVLWDQGVDRFHPFDGVASGASVYTFTESTTGVYSGTQLPGQTGQSALSSSTYSSVEPSCGRMDRSSFMNGFRLSPTLRR